ncbi:unnamed protein product [Merluccius merluccius]
MVSSETSIQHGVRVQPHPSVPAEAVLLAVGDRVGHVNLSCASRMNKVGRQRVRQGNSELIQAEKKGKEQGKHRQQEYRKLAEKAGGKGRQLNLTKVSLLVQR